MFCPEYRGRSPLKVSPAEWQDVEVFLFGPSSLPDLDWGLLGADWDESGFRAQLKRKTLCPSRKGQIGAEG